MEHNRAVAMTTLRASISNLSALYEDVYVLIPLVQWRIAMMNIFYMLFVLPFLFADHTTCSFHAVFTDHCCCLLEAVQPCTPCTVLFRRLCFMIANAFILVINQSFPSQML
uniref:Transmembrane protein n=1 Tax=Arundo donax TaxID=35708 RepID=A0A0A9HR97_ARUDO